MSCQGPVGEIFIFRNVRFASVVYRSTVVVMTSCGELQLRDEELILQGDDVRDCIRCGAAAQ